ncbi:TPA: restriction endonuclease subunit S [Salmonella enterica]|uniref:Restriction endonuclease subunit S n=1 Tax=Salmonella enterica TaxID=28901 RepID=A0A763QM71_SALER|nr:restriction endonuclease subunit S [Salmonella enterica]ECI3619467.1 restriction endonuclease subunit S [Salmonella enterica subsp. enterica]EDW5001143.1 restriction endonuclease subunit S [Salmonella enterica subsp. enterica serovar Isangi]EGT0614571.1 restriction endonuclease subunit S [Salmonella enterica]HAG3536895.1 restriction endonuclease subunit S [Salmonella enterica]
MSVDTLRETFHINRISTSDLQDFLTAQTYRPEITQAKNHILSLKNCLLQAVCTKPIQQGKSPKYAEKGLKCIKPKNTNDMLVSIDDIDWIDSSTKDQIQKQKLGYGDIVITRSGSGTIGRASIYCYSEEAYTNDHLFVVRPDKADSHYICSFLNSFHGQRLLEAGVSGSTGQLNLSNEHIKSIPLFRPDDKAQKYIGDKIRQAEQLRTWAKLLRTSVDDHLNSLNLPINEPPALLNRVSAQTMEDRLDPRPYRTHYLCLVHEIEKLPHDSISALVELASGCPVSSNDFLENSGIPLVRIRNIGFDDFIGLDTGVSQDVYQDATKYQAKDKMIVVGMDGIFRSQFFISDELPMLVNQRVAMLSPQNIRGELLTHWLNRPEGQMQLNQWAVKTTVEHTSLSDIGRVLIPRLDKSLENKLADYLLNARLAYRYAKFLTQVAKTLVEALIEGQLTEQQLIQAQQALEDGDNSLDQAIISKLSAEGYAIEGATPLFSDVDELYSLLEDAAQAEAEE